jgi:hypothetical protein
MAEEEAPPKRSITQKAKRFSEADWPFILSRLSMMSIIPLAVVLGGALSWFMASWMEAAMSGIEKSNTRIEQLGGQIVEMQRTNDRLNIVVSSLQDTQSAQVSQNNDINKTLNQIAATQAVAVAERQDDGRQIDEINRKVDDVKGSIVRIWQHILPGGEKPAQ